MPLLFVSFIAGILTTLAPCTLPLLPVILAGSAESQNKLRPFVIVLSLGISVFAFTLLLKASTLLLFIPQEFWNVFSGLILMIYAISMLYPQAYESLAFKLKFYKCEELLRFGNGKGLLGAILIGAALGPIFASCSPTYAVIVGIMLPENLGTGTLHLGLYVIGLTIPLLLIAYGSQSIFKRFKGFANPKSFAKRIIAVLLLVTGFMITFGWDKDLSEFLLRFDIDC
ncbi:MAG: cytochrome c biogenesis protein CcdA [Patescibacteria group bacterium]